MLNITSLNDIAKLYEQGQVEHDTMIQRALDNCYEMLPIDKFMDVAGIKLSNILPFDIAWNSFRSNIPIYVTDDLIRSFGYKGELIKQKQNLLNLVKKYKIPVIQLDNDKYQKFTHTLQSMRKNINLDFEALYPPITEAQLKSHPLHTLIMPRDLKKLWLVVNTDKGDAIRDYVITLDDLTNLYLEYQNIYRANQLTIKDIKIDELMKDVKRVLAQNDEIKEDLEVNQEILTEINTKFDIATDDRAPKTKSITKRDRFVILKTNVAEHPRQYYAVRVQHTSLKRTLKKLKAQYPNCAELVSIAYQPNGVNFFNLMKEKLKKEERKIDVKHNTITLRGNYTEAEFAEDIRNLDNSKKEVYLSESDEE
jgi:hypothetical protein